METKPRKIEFEARTIFDVKEAPTNLDLVSGVDGESLYLTLAAYGNEDTKFVRSGNVFLGDTMTAYGTYTTGSSV